MGRQLEAVIQPFNQMARQPNLQHVLLSCRNIISNPTAFNSCLFAIIHRITRSRILTLGLAYPAGINYPPLSIQGDRPFFCKLYENWPPPVLFTYKRQGGVAH